MIVHTLAVVSVTIVVVAVAVDITRTARVERMLYERVLDISCATDLTVMLVTLAVLVIGTVIVVVVAKDIHGTIEPVDV